MSSVLKNVLLACLLGGLLSACSDDTRTVDPPLPPSVPAILYSPHVGDSLRIYVGLPTGYDRDRAEPYHSVYLLDGDWYFDGSHWRYPGDGILGLLAELHETGTAPEAVLIGIGYEGTGENYRGRDFHTRFESFHNFVRSHLIPLVDSVHNTGGSAGRTLIGHSSGAYATMRTFVKYGRYPDSEFNNYIALSGDYSHDDLTVYDQEVRLCTRLGGPGSSLPVNLFLAAGSLEEERFLTSIANLPDSLESRSYADFRLRSVVYYGVGHGTHHRGFPDGLKWVFDWVPYDPDPTSPKPVAAHHPNVKPLRCDTPSVPLHSGQK